MIVDVDDLLLVHAHHVSLQVEFAGELLSAFVTEVGLAGRGCGDHL